MPISVPRPSRTAMVSMPFSQSVDSSADKAIGKPRSTLVANQFEQFRPIVLDLGAAHAGDAGQQAVADRANFGQFAQRLVVQDDIGRYSLLTGGIGPPLAQ